MTSQITRVPSIDSIPEVDFIKQTFADLSMQGDDEVFVFIIQN